MLKAASCKLHQSTLSRGGSRRRHSKVSSRGGVKSNEVKLHVKVHADVVSTRLRWPVSDIVEYSCQLLSCAVGRRQDSRKAFRSRGLGQGYGAGSTSSAARSLNKNDIVTANHRLRSSVMRIDHQGRGLRALVDGRGKRNALQ